MMLKTKRFAGLAVVAVSVIVFALFLCNRKYQRYVKEYRTSYDSVRAEKSMAVLRVDFFDWRGDSKYSFGKGNIVEVLENKTSFDFDKAPFSVGYLGVGNGLPICECTIYVKSFDPTSRKYFWTLCEDNGKTEGYTNPEYEMESIFEFFWPFD